MNELDAIQQQMAALGIDVSPEAQAQAPMYDEQAMLSPEDEAMFAPGGELAIEETIDTEGELPQEMPAYDIEELKIDIQPMLEWLPKEEFANLIIWMAEQFNLLNAQNNA